MKKLKHLQLLALAVGLMLFTGNVWGQYDGTGTFQKITTLEELESGAYYVFYGISGADNGALTNSFASSGRLANTSVAITGSGIINPAEAIVWLIEGNAEDGYTIYNEAEEVFCEITANSTSAYSLNNPPTHEYSVIYDSKGFFFISNHSSAASRGISIYNNNDWRTYADGTSRQTLHLYKLTEIEDPLLIAAPASLTGLDYTIDDGPSDPKSFTLSGTDLDGTIVTITAPTYFEISETEVGGYGATITIDDFDGTATEIWVQLSNGLSKDIYSGNIMINGGGADEVTVAVSGSVWPVYDFAEGFDNYPETGTGYDSGDFEGVAGNTWNYVNGRGTPTIDGKTVVLQNNTDASLNSLIDGGITEFSFDYMQAFSTNVNLEVYIDGALAVTVTTDGEQNIVKNSGNISISDVRGAFTIEFKQGTSPSGGQVAIDNFSWKQAEPLVDNPVFDLAEGTYFENQTVYIDNFDDYAESVEIRYTTNGDDPDETSSLYDNVDGIFLEDGNGAVTLKAIAIDGEDSSDITTAVYTFPLNVEDIATLRDQSTGSVIYRVTNQATLIGQTSFRNTKFFQDNSGFGIQIDDPNPPTITTSYDIGDNVAELIGTLGTFESQLQFTPSVDPGDPVSVGNVVTPLAKTLDDLGFDDQSRLIEVIDVEFEDGDGVSTFGGGGTTRNITDPSIAGFTGLFRNVFGDSDITGSIIPTGTGTVVGIIQENSNGYNLAARDLADLDFDGALAAEPTNHPTGFSAEANSSTAITVSWTDADPAADGYLIKGSDVSFAAIVEPVDGTPETDDFLVQNVEGGVESHQFTGLTPNTEYFFLIFPYNGAGTTINYKTDDAPEAQATTDAPPGLPYAQDFGGFVSAETLPEGWTLDDDYSYQGAFGSGATGGLRGNGALGFQLTGTAPNNNFTATLALFNNTGEVITDLFINYRGLVERVDQSGTPKWVVSVNGVEYPELEYLTADGVSKDVFAIFSGLSIAENEIIEIEWFTTSTGTSGTRRQIGITDVEIEVPVEYNGITNPELLPPDATVTIAGNQTLEVPLQVKNLIVEDGNSLIIAPVGTLTVTGVIGNNAGVGGLLIESSASGTGSLIHSTPGLQGISQRFIPAHGAKSATGWHFLSSPVNNFAIGSSDFEPETNDDFYAWDEGTNTWLNYKVGSNNITNFINGEGYLVAYQNDLTGVFTGTFNVGDVAVDLNLTSAKDDFNGWNLLGNPYPSAIDWSVVGNHTDTFEDVFAYVWDRDKDGGAGYTYIDGREPNAFIPANQGFFVKTKAAGSFTFNNDMRAHGGAFMKSSPADDRIVLRFAGDHYFDRTTLRIRKESHFSRDPLDALKLYSFDNDVPQIYTVTTDQRGVAINSIPTVDESLTIPVRLRIPANGPMTISADEITGQFEHHTVVLFDQKTGINHKLSETPVYSFTASTDDTDRFLLKFETVSVHELPAEAALHIYAHGSTVYLNSRESLDARVSVYNITGQQVHGQRMAVDGLSAINLNLPTGWYVVTVTTDKEMTTQKVFIR